MSTQHFETTVVGSGDRVRIALPFDPNAVWGARQQHYVTGSINGCTIRGALATDGGQAFLALGAAWRRDNGIAVGDSVDVMLAPEGPQVMALDADIAAALEA